MVRSRHVGLVLLSAAAAIVAFALLGSTRWVENRGRLATAASLIAEESWQASRTELGVLAAKLGSRDGARAGLELLSALHGDSLGTRPEPVRGEHLALYPVRAVLERGLAERRFEGCLRVVDLLRRNGAAAFPEFEAAALLELGRIEEARSIDVGSPRGVLGRRLAQLLGGERDLDRVAVRDRHGRLLGTVSRSWNDFVPEEGIEPELIPRLAIDGLADLEPTAGVRLTLDLDLSRQALESLGRYYRGSIVLLEPSSGDVLVAVSDPRTWKEGGTAAFDQFREPASIAKLITVTAAMRAGIDVDEVIGRMRCRGAVRYDDETPLYCSSINGRLRGLERALAVSCNVAFAELGRMVGRDALLAEYDRYGFAIGDGDSEVFGRVVAPQGTNRQLGELSIGLEASEITPVHAAMQAATFSNGGWMTSPRLYHSQDTYLGLSQLDLPAAPRWQVIESSWLPQIVSAMKAVVEPGGTAARVAPADFPVALKTGTASHPRYGFHVNYIGFGPMPDPRYAFSIRVTHQRTSQRVRRAAYAVTNRLLRRLADEPSQPIMVAAGE